MKHLMTLAALFVSSLAMAQIPTFPWNPDGNGDGVIGSSDLIGLLTVYGQEFQNAIVSENQESALLNLGALTYHHCKYSCDNLPGNWQLPEEEDLVPVLDSLYAAWLRQPITSEMFQPWQNGDYQAFRWLRNQGGNVSIPTTSNATTSKVCFCSIKQLPRVEYSACADVINDPGCANQLVSDGWYPMGSVSDSGTQAFWRYAQ